MMPIQAMRLRKGVSAPTGYPVVLSITSTGFSGSTTSHLVSMPATVSAGDLLVALIGSDGSAANSAVATPSGWTAGATATQINNSTRLSIFYKVAAGTEGGTTVDFVTTGAEELAAGVFRIQAGTYTATPENAVAASATNTTHSLVALSPSWGSQPVLWIGVATFASVSVTAYPYAGNNGSIAGGTAVSVYWATTTQTVSSRPAGSFILTAGNVGITAAVGIRAP